MNIIQRIYDYVFKSPPPAPAASRPHLVLNPGNRVVHRNPGRRERRDCWIGHVERLEQDGGTDLVYMIMWDEGILEMCWPEELKLA